MPPTNWSLRTTCVEGRRYERARRCTARSHIGSVIRYGSALVRHATLVAIALLLAGATTAAAQEPEASDEEAAARANANNSLADITAYAGDSEWENTKALAVQPFAFWQLGGGTYLRTAPIWAFNLKSGDYNVPFGFGIGQVMRLGKTVFNIFIEPQFTILHEGVGQPAFQLYTALNMQFIKKQKS